MARTSTSTHVDITTTLAARRVSTTPAEDAPASGCVLFEGRVAQIAGFEGGAVKLRFEDGGDASVVLADYVQQARAVAPARGSDPLDAATAIPWQPTGQRAHRVRKMLDGYTAGRKTALHELANGRPSPALRPPVSDL